MTAANFSLQAVPLVIRSKAQGANASHVPAACGRQPAWRRTARPHACQRQSRRPPHARCPGCSAEPLCPALLPADHELSRALDSCMGSSVQVTFSSTGHAARCAESCNNSKNKLDWRLHHTWMSCRAAASSSGDKPPARITCIQARVHDCCSITITCNRPWDAEVLHLGEQR